MSLLKIVKNLILHFALAIGMLLIYFNGQTQLRKTAYCSFITIQDSLQVSLYTPTMFRFRVSHIKGERFPSKYEIPFVIGKTANWNKVHFTKIEDRNFVYINTDSLQIRIEKKSLAWTIWTLDKNKKICPSDGPVYGMFKDGYTVFDNVSAFNAPSKINRYSHWFYNPATKNYTDVYLEADLIEDNYFIYGPSYPSLFAQLNELLGPEPLLPKKGYGFFQTQHLSCEGTQEKLLEVARKFRDKNIPLDNLVLDFEWGDGCADGKEITWGSQLNWSSQYTYPLSPPQMIKTLDSLHIDVMLIHHSAPDFKSRRHQGWTETVYNEQTWWNKYTEKLDMGIRGTWQDTRMNDITDSYIYNRTQNYYGKNKRVLFLGCRKMVALNPWDFRFSVMPTENMIGSRRYPYHWTEDCSSSWNEMAFQLKAINNTYGPMSGYSYIASDIIGSDWRIQARWNQFTCLSAIARSHNPKPWSGNIDVTDFTNKIRITKRDSVVIKPQVEPEQKETAEESIRKYLQLRYRLLPCIYSYAFVNYLTGMPVTRPLLLAFPDDYICSADAWPYEFMLGDNILVAPVYGNFNTMEIYLPKGHDWIDYNTKVVYKDGGIIIYNTTDINRLPLFVKAGAIIPMRQQCNWIDTKVADTITLDIYPADTLSTFTLYEDDGETTLYQEGDFSKTNITCKRQDTMTTVSIGAMEGDYKGKPRERIYYVRLNGYSKSPDKVLAGNQLIEKQATFYRDKNNGWSYDEKEQVVIIKILKATSSHTVIQIK